MRFSLVTVTRNNLAGLQETQRSVQAQFFSDFEWIVVDGASTDGTVEFLTSPTPGKSGESDGKRTIWISEPDCGIYDAMNKGLRLASGEYLLFLNAGDTLVSAETLQALSRLDSDFIYSDSREGEHYKRARSHTRAVTGMFTHHQAMVYRRTLVGDLRFDTACKIAADYKFTLAFLSRAKTVLYHPAPLCCFEPGGVSQTQVRAGRREQFRIRRELKCCSLPVNIVILLGQCAIMVFRRGFPGLYWWLKRARKPEEQKNNEDQK